MIAFNFPPEGNAGVYRPLRFVRHLPNHGWIPTVISAVPTQYERYDPALNRLIPDGTEVIRIKASDFWQAFQARRSRRTHHDLSGTQKRSSHFGSGQQHTFRAYIKGIVRTVEAWWYYPDMAMPWIQPAVEASVKMCDATPINVIWATAGPVSSFVVAQKSSLRTGIPYVLDFRDPWTITYNTFEASQPRWAKRRARLDMYDLLSGAQAIVFRYHTEAECFWHAYPGAVDESKVFIIPNGYESPIEEPTFSVKERCTVLYAGTLPDYRYDSLLKALLLMKQSNPAHLRQLRFLFVGEGMQSLQSEAAALGLTHILETAGPKSHAEIISLQREAQALLVLGRKSKMPGYELFAAAKLFGYLKAGRPIVGVLPEDETKQILHRLGVSTVADVDSITDIIRILELVIDRWTSGTLSSLVPDPKACEAYSSVKQTATLVRALEGLPPNEPFLPGSQPIPSSLCGAIKETAWLSRAVKAANKSR